MAPTTFEKQPGEKYPIGFNYYGKLPPGVRILSAEVSAVDVSAPGNDASDDVLQSTVGVVDGATVKVGVKGGVAGKSYKITVKTFLNSADDDNLEDECIMKIVEI